MMGVFRFPPTPTGVPGVVNILFAWLVGWCFEFGADSLRTGVKFLPVPLDVGGKARPSRKNSHRQVGLQMEEPQTLVVSLCSPI